MKHWIRWLLACICLTWLAARAMAAEDPLQAVQGHWLTEDRDGIILIVRNTLGTFDGRIVGGNNPGRLDTNSPDPARRSQPLRGQVILRDLRYDGDGKWSGGTIYDPDSGRTYACKAELRPDGTLKVRGFLGISLLGKSQVWTRYTGTSMDLPRN